MAERELYPDGEQRRRIMDFIMAAGQTLLENGAEVFRVEQTMEIMAASFHLREFHVYVLTNGIFASAGTAEMSEVRNVPTRTTHLGRVAAVNQLSRQIASGGSGDRRRGRGPSGSGQVHPFSKGLGAACGGTYFFISKLLPTTYSNLINAATEKAAMHLVEQMTAFDNISDCENDISNFSKETNAAFWIEDSNGRMIYPDEASMETSTTSADTQLHSMKMNSFIDMQPIWGKRRQIFTHSH